MNQFTRHEGLTVPLFQSNIDTDQIIPKQFLTRIERSGYGAFLFNDWRFEPDGTEKADFVLNDPKYAGATILVAGTNFGCGSSREHAAWSLTDFGFRAVIAPSFGDIFYNNSMKNGLLPVRLDEAATELIVARSQSLEGYSVTIDLESQTVIDELGLNASFEIDAFRKHCLLSGLDDIGLTLQNEEMITKYEADTEITHRFAGLT